MYPVYNSSMSYVDGPNGYGNFNTTAAVGSAYKSAPGTILLTGNCGYTGASSIWTNVILGGSDATGAGQLATTSITMQDGPTW